MDRRVIVLLSVAHCVIDLCQAVVLALMPFFKERYGLSYTAAMALILASSLASSIVQPIFGSLADRLSAPWLLPASLIAAGGGLVLAIFLPLYVTTLVAIAVSGLGVAAFHPEAARLMNFASGDRRTTGMSVFSVGGNAGFALGPIVATGLPAVLGDHGLLALLAPPAALALMLSLDRGRLMSLADQHRPPSGNGRALRPAQWGPFALLGVLIAFRSVVFMGLNSSLALYWTDRLSQTKAAAGTALSLFLGTGIAGTLLGGWIADRWGQRALMRIGLVLVIALLALLGLTEDAWMATVLLVPLGLTLFASGSPLVVLGQDYLPDRVGVASGVTIGLAVSCGGAAAPLLGQVADRYGIGVLPGVLAVLAVVATVLAFALPEPRRHAAESATRIDE